MKISHLHFAKHKHKQVRIFIFNQIYFIYYLLYILHRENVNVNNNEKQRVLQLTLVTTSPDLPEATETVAHHSQSLVLYQ